MSQKLARYGAGVNGTQGQEKVHLLEGREAWGRLLVGNTCPAGQFTVFAEEADDCGMNGTTSPTHRRSGRAFHKMRLQAQGRAHNGKKFKESCETVVVNAHGGLLMMKHEIDNGEMLVLTNPETLKSKSAAWCIRGSLAKEGKGLALSF